MRRVPFSVITAAKSFDPEAVGAVFCHFENFIVSQCLSDCVDEFGTHSIVDDDLYYQAQIALFRAIDCFQFREPPDSFMP